DGARGDEKNLGEKQLSLSRSEGWAGSARDCVHLLRKNRERFRPIYRCLEAKDGPEALAIFAQQMDAIALVFSDLTLPHMDGITLVRAARKMKPNMPIIVSSGQGEPAGMGELQALGGTNFLPKPYDTGKLLAAVHEALAARR